MNSITYSEEFSSKVIEWKFDAGTAPGRQRARYGIFVFAKSSDGTTVDCMIAIYKLEFTLAERKYMKENSILCWLKRFYSKETKEVHNCFKIEEVEMFHNFCRHRALSEFKKEGIIDYISFTEQKTLHKEIE